MIWFDRPHKANKKSHMLITHHQLGALPSPQVYGKPAGLLTSPLSQRPSHRYHATVALVVAKVLIS
jgi:hypothetical protein